MKLHIAYLVLFAAISLVGIDHARCQTAAVSDSISASKADSAKTRYSDSALIAFDTAVSLPHKGWLDSELVEIPELNRFGPRIHFKYPQSILVETDMRPVPFDTALLSGMNPISRENLPFFDQSPIPAPLAPPRRWEGLVEAGGGTVYQPILAAWGTYTFSRRTAVEGSIDGRWLNPAQSAIHGYNHISAVINAQAGQDPGQSVFQSQEFGLRLDYADKRLRIDDPSVPNSFVIEHKLSQFSADASLIGDASDKFHYDVAAADHEWSDDFKQSVSESSQEISLHTHFDPYVAHFRFIVDAGYARARMGIDTTPGISFGGAAPFTISSRYVQALFGRRKGEAIEWYGGVTYLGGVGPAGETYTSVLPVARIRMPFNPRWEFGASFEPKVELASMRTLTTLNPFYSALAAHAFSLSDMSGARGYDERSVVVDRINLDAFMNYMLSPDDELRAEARFITRSREPIFEQHSKSDSASIFTLTPKDTRRLQISFSGNFLLFTKDVLSGGVDFSSATIDGEDRAVPFEPTLKMSVSYHLNSLSDAIRPMVEFRSIARKDRTISFLNLEASADVVRNLSLTLRADNILGAASDFWTGFPENPRSLWATLRYSF